MDDPGRELTTVTMSDTPRSKAFLPALGRGLRPGLTDLNYCRPALRVEHLATLSPYVFRTWLAFAALILVVWGAKRIQTGDRRNRRIGQGTLNFVVGIVAATATLLALVRD